GVEVVALDEAPAETAGEPGADLGLAGGGDPHDDHHARQCAVGGLRTHPISHRTTEQPNIAVPSVVSMTVQVFSVVFSSMPKNRLTSQKPESLTWESTVEPPAMAKTRAASSSSESPVAPAAISPAVVVSATVAEPWATRSAVAMRNAWSSRGMPTSPSALVRESPMPLV